MRALYRVVVVSMLWLGVAAAQPVVHGRVVTAAGAPVRGATVSIEGGASVTTDALGRYAIAADAGATLIVMCDGYAAGIATAADRVDDVVLVGEAAETIEVHGE